MTVTELRPKNNKSFYGKALVLTDKNIVKLQSYDTIVSEYNTKTKKLKINGYYSATTAKHINTFIAMYGFNQMNKKQIENFTK